MTEQQKQWLETLISIYPKSRANRTQSETAWKKKKPTEELYKEFFERIIAWNRYWKASGTEPKYIPLLSTWLNSKYKDDIPSTYEARELKQEQTINRCRKCNNPVKHRLTFCDSCAISYQGPAQVAAEAYCTKMGLYERGVTSRGQARENMMVFVKKMSGKIGK